MSALHVTRGLPASGKTTWAKAWVAAHRDTATRVNRDDLRANLFGAPVLSYQEEEAVTAAQRAAVRALLASGRDVVVDDTHLRVKYVRAWADLAVEVGAELIVHEDFLGVDVAECVRRDAERAMAGERAVGESVIVDMHARFLSGGRGRLPGATHKTDMAAALATDKATPTVEPYEPDPGLLPAWLVDIDGTLALMGDRRGPFEWHNVHLDEPNPAVIETVQALASRHRIVVMSGRDGSCREATEAWLREHSIPFTALHMRAAGDTRKDSIVKAELFDQHVRHQWNVVGVLDDRTQVVQMWRAMGLTCMQVADGDF